MDDGHPIMKKLGKLFGFANKEDTDKVTDEIIQMVSEGHEQGVIEASEAEMIHNIFEFDEKTVEDIMTHRKNVIAIDVNMPMEEAAKFIVDEQFSRFPVYEEEIDNIVGVLHLKDVMHVIVHQNKDVTIKDIMREPYYVPESESIKLLFNEMQTKKVHVAIVIDEYGQTAGLVAMEDVLEEIVGNILDEYDEDDNFIQKTGEDTYVMDGMTTLDEIEDLLDIEFEDDFDTLNGFIVSQLEHVPTEDENADVVYKGYLFHASKVEANLILKVDVRKATQEEMLTDEKTS